MPLKNLLNKQINEAPEPLRSYIHDLQATYGEGAHMIQDLYQKEENIKALTMLVEILQKNDNHPPHSTSE